MSDGNAFAPPDAATLRPVAAICIEGLEPGGAATGEPIFERVNPAELLVDEKYQRDLSDRSLALIRKIVTEWDWRRFKPPIVAFADGGLQIIDGQHTAIAAASHPAIEMIPVMVVEAPELASRALAFIGHNRDRLAVTPMQLHHAAVAAGDPDALRIERVCDRAGLTLVRAVYGAYRWKAGETYAIGALAALIQRRGEEAAERVLRVLVEAELGPVSANDIKAADHLFASPDYRDQLDAPSDGKGVAIHDLAVAIKALDATAERDAKVFAAAQCVPLWQALAVTWFKKCRKRRKPA